MSIAQIQVIEDVFSSDEKAGIIADVTDVLAKYEGEGGRKNTVVTIIEVKGGDWGHAGNALAAKDVRPSSGSASAG